MTDLKNRLSYYLRLVARGETVTFLDRGRPVAQISPPGEAASELQRLAQAGLARLPVRKPARDLRTRRLPGATASMSTALDEDRDDRL